MVRHLKKGLQKHLSSTAFWSFFLVAFLGVLGGVLTGVVDAKIEEEGETMERISGSESFSFGGPTGEKGSWGAEEGALRASGEYDDLFVNDQTPKPEEGALLGVSSPSAHVISARNGVKTYKVQKGDTLSGVAANFGISMDTLKWANPGTRSLIQTGDALVIPPVDGIIYEVRAGDSPESITKKFRADAELVQKYNPGYQKLFDTPGSKVVLPYAKPVAYTSVQKLPTLLRYFALPARGWNWGVLHFENAVDIADNCGSPVYASAEGLVTEASAEGFWNEGYGNLVVIEHPNGTKTKYAHIEKSEVKIGDYAAQGEKIATIGNTGNTHGPTGCHLHFEVVGAQNPFAIR